MVVRTVAGALLRGKRAGEMVVGESNIGAVLRVQRHLVEVGKRAAVAIGTAGAVGTNSSCVNEMVTSNVLRERRDRHVAVHGFRHIDVPLRPAIFGAIGASCLHGST